MTISPGDPGPIDPQAPVPPYEGRRETADVDSAEAMRRDGATVGGATGPVESAEPKSDDAIHGDGTSPADEQPAEEGSSDGGSEEASVGPDHYTGTGRGENKSKD